MNAGCGFAFWLICARLFTAHDVGLAVSLISFATLVATFTNLGLPNTIVRFLPTSARKGELFTGSLYLVLLFSLCGAVVSVLLINHLVPRLSFVQSSGILALILILLIIGNTISGFMDGTLMAFRKGHYILVRSLIVNVPRVALPFVVVGLGLRGVVGAYTGMLIVGTVYGISVSVGRLMRYESFRPSLGQLRGHLDFAAANYFGGMFGVLPGTLLPIIVLSKLGASSAAFFYMPMQIAVFLNLITSSTAQALVAEASQTDNATAHRAHFQNAVTHLYQLLIPAVVLFSTAGWAILRLYGVAYVENGYWLLVVLCVASLFVGINWLGDTWLNIQKRSRAYFVMNAFNALAVVSLAYVLSVRGLVGVGLGWLCGQLICSVVYGVVFARSKLGFFAALHRIRDA